MSPCRTFWVPVLLTTFHVPHSPVVTRGGSWLSFRNRVKKDSEYSQWRGGSISWWEWLLGISLVRFSWCFLFEEGPVEYTGYAGWMLKDNPRGAGQSSPDSLLESLLLQQDSRGAEEDGRMNSHQQLMLFFFCRNLIFSMCFVHWFWHLHWADCTPPKAEWCKPVTITAVFKAFWGHKLPSQPLMRAGAAMQVTMSVNSGKWQSRSPISIFGQYLLDQYWSMQKFP